VNPALRSGVLLGSAVAIGGAAVAPPMDWLADESFAWHMAQHLLLVYPVALLLLLARPLDLYARFAGKASLAKFVNALRPLHTFAWPPAALAFFIGVLWATHFSPLYEASLEQPAVHVAEHFLFLAAGCIFWLPVVGPPPLRPLPYPARLFYLVVALPQGALLGMVITSAREPLYAHYTMMHGLRAALADQGNAAAVMWIAGGLAIFTGLLVTLAVWAKRESCHPEERAQRASRRAVSP
jgi:cytochrome c oxidase assembly factor CtaG